METVSDYKLATIVNWNINSDFRHPRLPRRLTDGAWEQVVSLIDNRIR